MSKCNDTDQFDAQKRHVWGRDSNCINCGKSQEVVAEELNKQKSDELILESYFELVNGYLHKEQIIQEKKALIERLAEALIDLNAQWKTFDYNSDAMDMINANNVIAEYQKWKFGEK